MVVNIEIPDLFRPNAEMVPYLFRPNVEMVPLRFGVIICPIAYKNRTKVHKNGVAEGDRTPDL